MNSLVGCFQSRIKGEHDFFIIVADFLKRFKLSVPDVLACHGFCYLDIDPLGCILRDEVDFTAPDLSDSNIISPPQQFKIHNILEHVTDVAIPESQEKYYIVDIGLRNYLLGFRASLSL